MIRNRKSLGPTLVVVFVLSAAFAASAFAETDAVLTTDGTSVTLTGEEIGGTAENFLEAGGQQIKCPGSSFPGHQIITTPHVAVPAGASEITVTPHYNNCNVGVHANDCDYELYDATTIGGVAGTYGVVVEIACPGTEKIRITSTPCNILVGTQTVTGFHLTNTAGSPDDLVLSGVAKVSVTTCGIPLTAEQHQHLTFRGENSSNAATEITLSHN